MNKYERNANGILVPAANGIVTVGGHFLVEHFRRSKSGQMKLIHRERSDNLVVNEGLDHVLNSVKGHVAQISTWYCSIFKGNYTPIATNTAATFTGAATEIAGGDLTSPGSRPTWTTVASTAQQLTNTASKASFVFNNSFTIYGAFIQSTSAFAAATGVLLAASRFASSRSVVNTDQLDVTYVLNASSS